MENDDAPVFLLKLDDTSGLKVHITSAQHLPEAARHAHARNVHDPKWQAHLKRFQEVAARGAAPLALVDKPLADGAIVRVVIDPQSEQPRLMVVSAATFTDEVLVQAKQMLFSYELSAPATPEAAELTLWPDGRVRLQHAGQVREFHLKMKMAGVHGLGYAKAIKERSRMIAPSDVKRVGMARVIELRGEKKSKQR